MSKKHVKVTSFGSKKFVATLPYLRPISDEDIDRLEIKASWQEFSPKENNEETFFDWMMEIDFDKTDRQIDDEHCRELEIKYNSRVRRLNPPTTHQPFFYDDRDICDPWPGIGNPPHYGGICWDRDSFYPSDDFPGDDFPESDCQIHGYGDSNYGDDGSWDIPQSMRDFNDSFCPEQAIIRQIPLRGLKYPARQALIREYCVI